MKPLNEVIKKIVEKVQADRMGCVYATNAIMSEYLARLPKKKSQMYRRGRNSVVNEIIVDCQRYYNQAIDQTREAIEGEP